MTDPVTVQQSTSAASVVFLHAHPDDECILTGAVMAKAAAAGIRTVVVYGTRGDAGETNADLGGETLGDRRVREAEAACEVLGVGRVVWLDYADSGMDGTETTKNPAAFCNAPPSAVAAAVVELLSDENVFAVFGYDRNGTYGHPDHKQVHAAAHVVAPALGAEWVLEATYNREYLASLPDSDGSLDPDFASAEAELSHFVTGDRWVRTKLDALMHHRSQVPDDWDSEHPDIDGFRLRFGTEWFVTTALGAGRDLGSLSEVLEPRAEWVPPDL